MLDLFIAKIKEKPMPNEIVAIYVYGSFVQGKLRDDSDVDIAVLPSFETNDFDRLQLISKTAAIVASVLNSIGIHKEVSILDMRGKYVSLQLLYKIITEGIMIYQSSLTERIYFEQTVKREYFDFIPYVISLRKRKYGDLYKKV
jgi:predicted nucleotidyltransferase